MLRKTDIYLDRLLALAEELLRVAKCPNCDGSGVTVRRETRMEPVCCGNLSDHGDCCNDPIPSSVEDVEPEPCQWCHELERALASAPAVPRCQCCGYLVTESEHRGCLRSAAHPVPDGWNLVPVEPTREMLIAGQYAKRFYPNVPSGTSAESVYRAMLEAAPTKGGTE